MPTPLRVVPQAEPYFDAIAEGSLRYASANRTPPERVVTLAAVLLRETWAGWAPGYEPLGSPDGSGDWTARRGHWTACASVEVYPDSDEAREQLRALGYGIPKHRKTRAILPGPYAIPCDHLGWGRGLWQIDYLGGSRDLILPAPWPVDRQVAAACAVLHQARRCLVAVRHHDLYERAVIAAYNCGPAAARAGVDAGDPDVSTSGSDYSRDVLTLRDAIRARWPSRFPAEVA